MKRLSASLAFAIFFAGCAAKSSVDDQTKTEIQSIYDRIGEAIDRNDLEGVTRNSLPTASIQYADGTQLALAPWKGRAARNWSNVKQSKSRFVCTTMSLVGDALGVTYVETHEALVTDPQDGKDHQIGYDSIWEAILKKTDQGWKISRSVERENKITRDGMLILQNPSPAQPKS